MSKNEVLIGKSGKIKNFAFVVYEDSCKEGWKEDIENMHVKALWIYHDKDKTEDGELKKPHYHVMIMWDGPIALTTARSVAKHFGAANDYVEPVRNKISYARYMCHIDQPNKHQYGIELLQELGGVNKMDLVGEEKENKVDIAREVLKFCKESKVWYYCDIIDYCFGNNEIWANLLLDIRFGRLIQDYIKSLQAKEG